MSDSCDNKFMRKYENISTLSADTISSNPSIDSMASLKPDFNAGYCDLYSTCGEADWTEDLCLLVNGTWIPCTTAVAGRIEADTLTAIYSYLASEGLINSKYYVNGLFSVTDYDVPRRGYGLYSNAVVSDSLIMDFSVPGGADRDTLKQFKLRRR